MLTAIGGAVRLLLRKFEVFDSHVVRSGAVELEFVRRLGIIDGRLDRLDTQYQTVREALSVSTAEQERHFSWHERHDGA